MRTRKFASELYWPLELIAMSKIFCLSTVLLYSQPYNIKKCKCPGLEKIQQCEGFVSHCQQNSNQKAADFTFQLFWNKIGVKSVHFKMTVVQSSFLSKVLSFSLIFFLFQKKWQHFWKKWGLRNFLLKINFSDL